MPKKGGAKKEKKGKKPHKNKPTSVKYKHYVDGKATKKFCPRCGPGTFLGDHKTRLYCGKCKYTEFSGGEKKVEKEGALLSVPDEKAGKKTEEKK